MPELEPATNKLVAMSPRLAGVALAVLYAGETPLPPLMDEGQEQLVQLEDEEDELIELLLWVGALESTGYVIKSKLSGFGCSVRRGAPQCLIP